ncbi:MAG TPA: lipoyl(octanoyl) transferase LipB [Methylomirabilota bacterium]|nr:lipoyl(octanoyl) transferase LipB [Methylomirabilota bacterium]
MRTCHTVDLGLIGYAEACALQKRIVSARKAGLIGDVLLLCEHPHVITQGRNGKREHLLAGERLLRAKGVEFFETSRGGDVTYHGPGQLVGYPILQLNEIRRDVAWYVRMLEEAMIRATADFGVAAFREAGKTGVWVESPRGGAAKDEKLAAIGVHLSRWVTSHGFAYNVSTDLRYFELIVPCGIADRRPTSLEKVLDRPVALTEVSPRIARHLGDVFGLDIREGSREMLLAWLSEAESANGATAGTSPAELAAGAIP